MVTTEQETGCGWALKDKQGLSGRAGGKARVLEQSKRWRLEARR